MLTSMASRSSRSTRPSSALLTGMPRSLVDVRRQPGGGVPPALVGQLLAPPFEGVGAVVEQVGEAGDGEGVGAGVLLAVGQGQHRGPVLLVQAGAAGPVQD